MLAFVASLVAAPAPAWASNPPQTVSVVGGRRALAVTWTPPTVVTAVNHYTASVAPGGQKCTGSSSATGCTISGLTANTSYVVSVVTCDDGSESMCSANIDAVSRTPGPPAAPAAPTVVYLDDQNTVRLTWGAPPAGAGIDSYLVTPSPSSGLTGTCLNLITTGTTCDFSGLTSATSYTFRVTANGVTNSTGNTGSSSPSPASIAKIAGPPGTPLGATSTRDSDTSVILTWSAPAAGTAPVTRYTVTTANTGVDATQLSNCGSNPATRTCTFTGLAASTPYTFQVASAGEVAGVVSAGNATAGPLQPGAPGRPDAPTVQLGDLGKVTVNWTLPTGGAPDSYTVAATSNTGQHNVTGCVGAVTTSCDISGLDPNTSYTFTVTSVRSGYPSLTSGASDPVVSKGPATPNQVTAVLGNAPGKATVSWNQPADGGDVSYFTVTATNSSGVALSPPCAAGPLATSCSFTGLNTGLTYTFVVTAVGDLGSVPSAPSAALMVDKPGTPTAVVAALGAGAPGTATVTWGVPADGGVVATYTVTASSTNGGAIPAMCTVTSQATRSCTFSGLDLAKLYGFTVSAINASGPTDAATTTQVVYNKPLAPTVTSVVLGMTPGTATVNWTAGLGGAASGFTVTPSPQVAGSPAACTAGVGATSCAFTGLDPETAYTFVVTATNPSGSSASVASASTVAGAPGTPTAVTVTLNATPGNVTVAWTAPSTGGTPTSYTVTPTSSDGGALPAVCTVTMPNTLSCLFTGLDTAKLYAFRVRAINVSGFTDAAVTTAVVPDAPGAPSSVAAVLVAGTPGSMTVTWGVPAGGGAVTSYTVTPTSNGGSLPAVCTVSSANSRTCTFTGLTLTNSYAFTVKAINASGSTNASATAAMVPDAPGPPTSAQAVLVATTPGSMTVTWGVPAGGGAVAGYTVTASSSNGGTVPAVCTVPSSDPRTCTFTSLTQTSLYAFTVSAINVAGHSEASATTEVVPAAPGMPTSAQAALVAATPGSVTVTWGVPASGGAVAIYTVTASSSNGGSLPAVCTVSSGNPRTCTFTSLTQTSLYAFTVSAINVAGHSEASATTEVVPNAPGAPATVAAVLGATAGDVTVSWSMPVSGGAASSYTVTATSTAGGTVPSVCTVTVLSPLSCSYTGLTAQPYAFTVRAINASGFTDATPTSEVVPAAPGMPTSVQTALVAGTPGSVTVTWSPPAGGAGAVSRYTVTATSSNGGTPLTTCTVTMPNPLSCLFTGLNPTKLYAFTVSAINASGHAEASATTEVVPAPPTAPTTVGVTLGASPGTATVSWGVPAGGGVVTGYTVTPNPSSVSPPVCNLPSSARSCNFTGLDLATPYTFTVTALGVAGQSTASFGPLVASTPSAPGTPTVVVTASGVVTVTWTASLTGGLVTDYTVTASTGPTSVPACTHVVGLTCSFSGLTPTTAYTFLVTANGDLGGTPSVARSVAVKPGPPSAPVTPTLALAGPNAVRVSWGAATAGGPVTGYTVASVPAVSVPVGCTNVNALSCVFDHLASGKSYSFTVTAIGPAGSSSAAGSAGSIIPGPPDAPGKPTVTLNGVSGQVLVSWVAPSPGAGITSYTVQNAVGADVCTSSTTSCVVTGLSGSGYTFRVQAVGVTDSGNSAFSPLSDPITPGAVGAPAMPNQPVAQAIGVAQLSVSWTMPTGGPVTSYTVAAVPPLGGTAAGCTTTVISPCVFTGLDTTVGYQFQVSAHGPLGDTVSALSTAVTPATPRRPGTPTVTLTGPGTATVAWGAPVGGGPVTRYQLTSNQSVSIPGSCGTDPSVRSCALTGLDPALSYTFEVEAHGPLGDVLSATSAAVTPAAPGQPGSPTVVLTAVSAATVSWTAPTAGGPSTGYTLTANNVMTRATGCGNGQPVTSCQVTGLDKTKSYTFQVAANGPLGPTLSDNSVAVVPDLPGVPATPTAITGVPGTVTVNWDAPAIGAGPILSYSVLSDQTITAPDGCTLKNVTTCVFTGLNTATPYTFKVRANGPFGHTDSAASSQPITPSAPSAPGTPSVAVVAPGTVLVTWTPSPSGGGIQTGYTVTSDPATTSPCVNMSASTCSFTGLDQATSYTFLVTANGPAVGTPSVARSRAVIPGAPNQPGTPTVQVTAPHVVTVSWTPPPAGAGPVTGYMVTSDQGGASPCVNVTVLSCDSTVLDGVPYTFLVTAVGPGGFASSAARSVSVTVAAPGAPGTPGAVVQAAGTVRVTWTPSTGGLLTGYTVSSSPSVNAPSTCVNTSALSCEFTGLGTGDYTFSVTAKGPAGTTASAARSNSVTPIAPGEPGTPVAAVTSPTSVRVVWPASSGSGPLSGYTVTSDPAVTPPNGCIGTSELFCDFTGLTAGQSYSFLVTAKGPAGSTASAVRSATVTPGAPGAPARPGTPTVQVTAPHVVTVSWTPSPAGAGPVTGYTVTSDQTGSSPCVEVAALSCDFTVLDGVPYTFLVTAVGPGGFASSAARSVSVTVAAPGAPGTPSAVVRAAGTVRVSWTASSGGLLTGYTVSSDSGVSAPGSCVGTSALSCDFTGLGTGDYTFLVTANGPAGATASEARSDVVTVAAPGAPGTPVAAVTSPTSVRVVWPASSGSGPLSGYTVTSDPAVTPPNGCIGTSELFCDFTGLTAGQSYSFLVTAKGPAGSTASAVRSATVTPSATSTLDAPGKPTVAQTDVNTSVRVSWVAPGAGAGIAGYTVRASFGGFGCATVPGSVATSCVVTNLNPATSYTFQVRAVGEVSGVTSGWSPASEAIIPAILAAPTNVDAVGTNHQIAVSWTRPTGAGVISYLATANPGGATCTAVPAESECVIGGLTNGTSYTVTVVTVAADSALTSVPSAASSRVRPTAGAPGVPTGVKAVAGDGSVAISWIAPTWIGDGILSYTATATGNPDGLSCVSTTLGCTITGLTNANDYQITVVAIGRYASGNSAPSSPVLVTPRLGTPVPTSVTVTPGALTLGVQFAPGTNATNVISYTATAVAGAFGYNCTTANASTTACVITGVTAGTTYSVTVAANLVGGGRSASSTPARSVIATTFAAPALPTAVPTGTAIYGPLTSSVTGALPLGSSPTITGATYSPFTAITVGVYPSNGSGPVVLATAVTDANGQFSVAVPITGISTGSYTIVAAGMRTASTVRYRSLAVSVTAGGA